jgi:predicted nucleic acid-binding protein
MRAYFPNEPDRLWRGQPAQARRVRPDQRARPGVQTFRRDARLEDNSESGHAANGEDYRTLLTSGLVVIDTNVLLNLYRYNDQTRDDLLSVLRRLGERLWIPRQVVEEFWRNREAVLRDPRDTAKTTEELNGERDRAIRTFRTWTNRVGLSPERTDELVDVLSTASAKSSPQSPRSLTTMPPSSPGTPTRIL